MMRRMGFGSAGEMIFLFILALVVLGPKRLPGLARQLGKFMNEFKRASNEFKYQIESEINNLEAQEKRAKQELQQILPPVQLPNPVALLGTVASGTFAESNPSSSSSITPATMPSTTPSEAAHADSSHEAASAKVADA